MKCEWDYQEMSEFYQTTCEHAFCFSHGEREGDFKYCPYCGQEIDFYGGPQDPDPNQRNSTKG